MLNVRNLGNALIFSTDESGWTGQIENNNTNSNFPIPANKPVKITITEQSTVTLYKNGVQITKLNVSPSIWTPLTAAVVLGIIAILG